MGLLHYVATFPGLTLFDKRESMPFVSTTLTDIHNMNLKPSSSDIPGSSEVYHHYC